MIDAYKGIVKYLKKASASTALPHGLVKSVRLVGIAKLTCLNL